jgi:hypothetical protein
MPARKWLTLLGQSIILEADCDDGQPVQEEALRFAELRVNGHRTKVRDPAAALHSRIRVDARLQSQSVNIADDVGHVSRALAGSQRWSGLGIDHDVAFRIAGPEPPALVDVDILIAQLRHAI